jgi:hypothetical protein
MKNKHGLTLLTASFLSKELKKRLSLLWMIKSSGMLSSDRFFLNIFSQNNVFTTIFIQLNFL